MSDLVIYTDGASRGNPGPGGYGAILMWKGVAKEISAGYRKTTNNRMELMAVIAALELLNRDGVQVTVYTDSQYIVNSVEKGWLFGWVKVNFKDKKNPDLWKRYLKLHQKHQIKFQWVKGHASNKYNNRCDELATYAADHHATLIDEAFEKGLT